MPNRFHYLVLLMQLLLVPLAKGEQLGKLTIGEITFGASPLYYDEQVQFTVWFEFEPFQPEFLDLNEEITTAFWVAIQPDTRGYLLGTTKTKLREVSSAGFGSKIHTSVLAAIPQGTPGNYIVAETAVRSNDRRTSVYTQILTNCSLTLPQNSTTISAGGGQSTIQIRSNCPWTIYSNTASWVHIPTLSSFGNTGLVYNVAANRSFLPRQTQVLIESQTYEVNQEALVAEITGMHLVKQNQLLSLGATATGGNSDLTFQWYKDNMLLSDSSPNFVVNHATAADSGVYRVQIIAPDLSSTSLVFPVRVLQSSSGIPAIKNPIFRNAKPEVIWREASGFLALWEMSESKIASTAWFYNGDPVDARWRLAALADFDGDENTDLLWQSESGQIAVWLMNGTEIRSAIYLYEGQTVDPDWQIIGAADLNGDLFPDLIWRHKLGYLALWVMNGSQVKSTSLLYSGLPVPMQWNLVGFNDFDHDGNTDLLWQDNRGNLAVWFMDHTSISSAIYLDNLPNAGPDWKVAALNDFNLDGEMDLLWWDNLGRLAIWYLKDLSLLQAEYALDGETIPLNWSVNGPK